MANLGYISPFFIVANLKNAVSFYVDKLGFSIHFIGPPGDEYFAIVGRDKISIFLKEILPGINAIPNHTRHEWARWDAFILTEDPDKLYEEYRSAGISFHDPIRVNGDNLRGFEIKDADGYVLYFGRPN
jgi:catechol 2,3-dioxygenase-like lactoylglutathione lyase family enzyme